jgi:hypothetical protein
MTAKDMSYVEELKLAYKTGYRYLDTNLWIFYKDRPCEIEVQEILSMLGTDKLEIHYLELLKNFNELRSQNERLENKINVLTNTINNFMIVVNKRFQDYQD